MNPARPFPLKFRTAPTSLNPLESSTQTHPEWLTGSPAVRIRAPDPGPADLVPQQAVQIVRRADQSQVSESLGKIAQ